MIEYVHLFIYVYRVGRSAMRFSQLHDTGEHLHLSSCKSCTSLILNQPGMGRRVKGRKDANGQLAEGCLNPASCIYAHHCTSLYGCNRVVFCVVCFCTIPC
jgi:hypothetical protein